VDATGLVALLNARDEAHARCREALGGVAAPLGIVWPGLVRALEALSPWPAGADGVWEMIERGALRVLPLGDSDVPRLRELMSPVGGRKPLVLSRACLVRVAEREGLEDVLSLDRDLASCRIGGRRGFRIRPASAPAGRRAQERRGARGTRAEGHSRPRTRSRASGPRARARRTS
jgi:predicted nucleic acid-binding protein